MYDILSVLLLLLLLYLNIAGEDLILHLLRVFKKPSQKINYDTICYILSRIEFQHNLQYGQSILAKYQADRKIYGMMQTCDNMNTIAAGIKVLAEMIVCNDSIIELIDDGITQVIQNQLNKISNLNKIRMSTLNILIHSALFAFNLSQQDDIIYAAEEIDLINNIILCLLNWVFNLLITNEYKSKIIHQSKYQKVKYTVDEMLKYISGCICSMFSYQPEIMMQSLISKISQNNEHILMCLFQCKRYQSNVRKNVLKIVTCFIMNGRKHEIKIFMNNKYGLLKSIKKLLNAEKYKCNVQELIFILKIIANLLNSIKFGDVYSSIIINDDNFLYLISNGLQSNNAKQCINAVFAVNNILSSGNKALVKRLLYWQEGYIIFACAHFIKNFNEVIINNMELPRWKTLDFAFEAIRKLFHCVVALCQEKVISPHYVHFRLYECSWMEAMQDCDLVVISDNVKIPNLKYLKLIKCKKAASDIGYLIKILDFMENCDDESWNEMVSDVFSDFE